jgi:hypothetical protein
MPTRYKIHPGIGIARLGNSPDAFCISPEAPAVLPIDCDDAGNPLVSSDGETELRIDAFKDAEGRIKRQAARFQVYVYDEDSPEGRPLQIGDAISGGGNQGHLVDIQWRVHLANKKASWYEFRQLEGEHGYAPSHPRRNASITAPEARQRLIIDPGPRIVDRTHHRRAQFDPDSGDMYAPTFPPELRPESIETLGELKTDDLGRLLVLGGHGHSGSFLYDEFGQPRIDTYANTDGWFDDTSDGPVTARLVMYSENVQTTRFIDVEYPAWVIVGYPAYVPQILDIVTMEETMSDMFVREMAARTDIYGEAGTFDDPEAIDPTDSEALIHWQGGRLVWNKSYKPWFYRDIWTILFRPDEYTFLTSVLWESNYPHNQSPRGNLDPFQLGVPPSIKQSALEACERECIAKHESGELFVETLGPALALLERRGGGEDVQPLSEIPARSATEIAGRLQDAIAAFVTAVGPADAASGVASYLRTWRDDEPASSEYAEAKEKLERAVDEIADQSAPEPGAEATRLQTLLSKHLRSFETGRLIEDYHQRCIEAATHDPYRDYRRYVFDALRKRGEENLFRIESKPSSRVHGLPLMPLLAGDNPLSNTLPSKFLRLTDLQYFLLSQWARGMFLNEEREGWAHASPWTPYSDWVNRTGSDLDRGVMTNVLGGSFCPGGEVGWIIRNPAIYLEPFRIKADPDFSSFSRTAAQANVDGPAAPELDLTFFVGSPLSQDDDFERGMQPGDLTKHSAVPWQADFNECSTQSIDVTYEQWNKLYPSSDGDSLLAREQKVWETLWWPAHRPLQTYELGLVDGSPTYPWVDWSFGIPQTNAGDLKMVTHWWKLGFVRLNPNAQPSDLLPTELPPTQKYVSVERSDPVEKEES